MSSPTPEPPRPPDLTPEQAEASKAGFARSFIEVARRLGVTGNIAFHAEGFRLLHEERPPFPLGDAWAAWLVASPERKAGAIEHVVGLWARNTRVPERYPDARSEILPAVRTRYAVATRHLLEPLDGPVAKLPHALVSEHLATIVTYPIEGGLRSVEQPEFERWGVTFERAHRQACLNLADRSREPWKASPDWPGMFRSPWSDHRDVARLLVPHVIGRLPLRGDPVALAPAEDCLVIAGTQDEKGLLSLAKYARQAVERSHSFSFLRPVRLVRDRWLPWLPDPTSGAWAGLHLLACVEHATEVQFQNVALARLFAHAGDDVHPAAMEMRTSPAQLDVRTVAVWEAGRPNVLPRAEALEFRREGTTLAIVPWAAAEEALGDRIPVIEGSYPERRRADEFPEDWQIAQLPALT